MDERQAAAARAQANTDPDLTTHLIRMAGLLAQADGGVITLAMAERLPAATAALLAAALDTGEAVLERDGLARRLPARVAKARFKVRAAAYLAMLQQGTAATGAPRDAPRGVAASPALSSTGSLPGAGARLREPARYTFAPGCVL